MASRDVAANDFKVAALDQLNVMIDRADHLAVFNQNLTLPAGLDSQPISKVHLVLFTGGSEGRCLLVIDRKVSKGVLIAENQ